MHLPLEVVLGILGEALRALLLVLDGLGTAGAFGVRQCAALRQQFFLQTLNLVGKFVELELLGFVLPLQVGVAALAFIGLAQCRLKEDDCYLCRFSCSGSGRRLCSGTQGKTQDQRKSKCKRALHSSRKLLRNS